MSAKLRFILAILVANVVLISGFQPAIACGPFTVDPVFGFTRHGEYPLTDYSRGRLGLIPNSYGRISLFVFYRYLNELPLSETEQNEVARAIGKRVGNGDDSVNGNAASNDGPEPQRPVDIWIMARALILGGSPEFGQYKQLPDQYSSYLNCLDGAFITAADTLRDRIAAKHSRTDLADWARGQDAVFSNCEDDGGILPAATGGQAPVWLKKDREYQTAAALFYKELFSDARIAFEAISRDEQSIWRHTANYLVARTYIREASFIDTEGKNTAGSEAKKNGLLTEAAKRLKNISADPAMSEFHESAAGLLGLVKYRLDPRARTVELSRVLSSADANRNIFNDLTDFIWLLDRIEARAEAAAEKVDSSDESAAAYDWDYDIWLRGIPEDERKEDLTDWLLTYQAADGYEHALEKWKGTRKIHWLTGAISKASIRNPGSAELVNDAAILEPGSPAFFTVMYHAIRLSIDAGNVEVATRLTDRVFDTGFTKVPVATRNSFYAQRIGLAGNLSEFLRYAKRTPTGYVWSDDTNEAGFAGSELEELAQWKNREMFGEDAVQVLNTTAPLSVWLRAANDEQIPGYLRDFLASAGWIRAFMLKDNMAERAFARLVSAYSKDYQPLFRKYAAARTTSDREAAGLIVIGRYPVLEPSIPSGWGRKVTRPTTIDSNRGNWWCLDKSPDPDGAKPGFLSDAEYADGRDEYRKLSALGEGSTAYSARALAFARKYPRHRSTPEILHLAVRSTRYGCKDDQTGKLSNAAFRLLHTRYRNSIWTRRTPYWYESYQ